MTTRWSNGRMGPSVARINRSVSLTSGLVGSFCVDGGRPMWVRPNGERFVSLEGGGSSYIGGAAGPAARYDGNQRDRFPTGWGWPDGAAAFTKLVLVYAEPFSSGYHTISSGNYYQGAGFCYTGSGRFLLTASDVAELCTSPAGTVKFHRLNALAVTYDGNGGIQLWANGSLVASAAVAPQSFNASMMVLAARDYNDVFYRLQGSISVYHEWSRVLRPDEIRQLSANPFLPLAQRRISVMDRAARLAALYPTLSLPTANFITSSSFRPGVTLTF